MLEHQTIKPAPITKDDASWYKPLYTLCFFRQDPWLENIEDPKFQAFHLNKQAFIFIQVVDTSVDILTIGVHPDFRKKGFAQLLLEYLINKAPFEQAFFLEVERTNTAAINLYKKVGFKEISIRKGYYPKVNGGAVDALVMAYQG